jgi:cytochrome c oxidase accessory protein FixG
MAETATRAPYENEQLYADHKKVYPQSVSGPFRRLKWAILALTLGAYYLLPFVRWDRGPNAPDQAILVDLPKQRFYFFFIEIWPQEIYYLTGLLILAAVTLFLVNALAGRIWCGYTCPQTVWTDLFLQVERWVEGDRRERIKLDEGPWSISKARKKAMKHVAWLVIAWWTGGAWVLYFADAPTLVWQLATFQAPLTAWMWIGILTLTTYLLAGFAREQVCTYMCPWPRIQAALTDEEALNVTYRIDRGEPRGSLKKAAALEAKGEPVGDCIDCFQCVAVCPTGIDIREGIQLECIQCGLCIDACDTVMRKVDRPAGLIGYDTDLNIAARKAGKPTHVRFIRPRTIIYAAIILVVSGLMLTQLLTRDDFGLNVLHDRNPQFVRLSDGGVRNGYTVRLLNKALEPRVFTLNIEGLPGARLEVIGIDTPESASPSVEVGPDTTRELRVLVFAPPDPARSVSTPVTFTATNLASDDVLRTSDFFKSPGE